MTCDFTNELLKWSEQHTEAEKGRRAHRVYVRCLMRKKTGLANAIKNKYGSTFPKPDDRTIALGLAMMAMRDNPDLEFDI